MTQRLLCLASMSLALLACNSRAATVPTQPPDAAQAKQAIIGMFGEGAAEMIGSHQIVLGTCISTPAKYAPKKGQFSCTFLLKSPGGSSESQVDFYFTRSGWVAEPSSAQEELPFPDPKLNTGNGG